MKQNFIFTLLALFSMLSLVSCSDWTEPVVRVGIRGIIVFTVTSRVARVCVVEGPATKQLSL